MTMQSDIAGNADYRTVLDHGFVGLVDRMGDDAAIVQAARVSYGQGTKTVSDDRALIRYLMRHSHSTPFEMCQVKLHVKAPLFVARQWMRHRTGSYNEVSARYSEMTDEFYVPEFEQIKAQSADNKQGRGERFGDFETLKIGGIIERTMNAADLGYEALLKAHVARELARVVMPLASYTEFYCSVNLHNLLHFLRLRADSHAQYEIRVYAEAIIALVAPLFPLTFEAWEDYSRGGYRLSRMEVEALQRVFEGRTIEIDGASKREIAEFKAKFCA